MELLLLVDDDDGDGECVGAAPLFGDALGDDGELVCANASTVDTRRKPPAEGRGKSSYHLSLLYGGHTEEPVQPIRKTRALKFKKQGTFAAARAAAAPSGHRFAVPLSRWRCFYQILAPQDNEIMNVPAALLL